MTDRRITSNHFTAQDERRKGDHLKHMCGILSDLSFKNMNHFAAALDATDHSLPTSERLLAAAEKILADGH